jgi:uncharacterized DUF497 family protein
VIVWDEPKRQQNLAKHSLDFAELDLSFFPDCFDPDGEDRSGDRDR